MLLGVTRSKHDTIQQATERQIYHDKHVPHVQFETISSPPPQPTCTKYFGIVIRQELFPTMLKHCKTLTICKRRIRD